MAVRPQRLLNEVIYPATITTAESSETYVVLTATEFLRQDGEITKCPSNIRAKEMTLN